MEYKFEKFTKVGVSFSATISIRRDGIFGFSRGAVNKFKLLDGDWAVVLHFDPTAKAIGLQFTRNVSDPGAIPLSKQNVTDPNGEKNVNVYFGGKSFLDYYGIPYTFTRSFQPVWDDDHQMAIIRLDKGIDTSKGRTEEDDTQQITE